jgi:hypothetical protein
VSVPHPDTLASSTCCYCVADDIDLLRAIASTVDSAFTRNGLSKCCSISGVAYIHNDQASTVQESRLKILLVMDLIPRYLNNHYEYVQRPISDVILNMGWYMVGFFLVFSCEQALALTIKKDITLVVMSFPYENKQFLTPFSKTQ